ncbi:cytochrome P450 [Streptomyces sp. NPDC001858]
MARSGPGVDLVSSFALPIPSFVICELLGVPYADRDDFQKRSLIRFDAKRHPTVRKAALDASLHYMAGIVARQRRAPGEGLIGTLIREHGEELDDEELTGICDLLLLGGFETTAHMLALSSLLLMQNPRYIDLLRDERLPELIEELLRYLSVVQTGIPRVAHGDTTLAGQRIRRGERLLCWLPSGNRDIEAFPDSPDRFRPRRNPRGHLAFGHGIHHCLGAPLARMELRVALPALFERFPELTLQVPVEKLHFRRYSAVYGLDALPVVWDPASTSPAGRAHTAVADRLRPAGAGSL